jgi:hypothetical protein
MLEVLTEVQIVQAAGSTLKSFCQGRNSILGYLVTLHYKVLIRHRQAAEWRLGSMWPGARCSAWILDRLYQAFLQR